MTRLALIAPALLLACSLPTVENPTTTIELRAFEVPPEHADRLSVTLNHVLSGNTDTPIGRARTGPGGTLLVAAPSTVIDGVEPLIDAVTAAKPPPAPNNLSVHYWLVEGVDGEVGHDERLNSVATTLASIVEADGPQYFELLASQRITSLEGERAEATTLGDFGETWFMQRIDRDPNSGAFVGEIHIREDETVGRIETRIALSPDQTAVLAATSHDSASIYILVRPQVL